MFFKEKVQEPKNASDVKIEAIKALSASLRSIDKVIENLQREYFFGHFDFSPLLENKKFLIEAIKEIERRDEKI